MGRASKDRKARQSRDFVAEGRNFHPFGCSTNGEEVMLPVAGVHSPSQPGVPPSYLGCRGAATWNSPGTTEATALMGSTQDTARLTRGAVWLVLGPVRGHCTSMLGSGKSLPAAILHLSPCHRTPEPGVSIAVFWQNTTSNEKQYKFVPRNPLPLSNI